MIGQVLKHGRLIGNYSRYTLYKSVLFQQMILLQMIKEYYMSEYECNLTFISQGVFLHQLLLFNFTLISIWNELIIVWGSLAWWAGVWGGRNIPWLIKSNLNTFTFPLTIDHGDIEPVLINFAHLMP